MTPHENIITMILFFIVITSKETFFIRNNITKSFQLDNSIVTLQETHNNDPIFSNNYLLRNTTLQETINLIVTL